MTIIYGSLFTGIGGFDLGFDRAGMQCAWQVEKYSHCLNLLDKYWPDIPKFGDITNVTGLPTVDLLCGGFPCQDLSIAGQRKGLAGERSGLWFEFLRVITELKPQWVVIENVPGLLSSNEGRDFAIILHGLEKCGYWWAYRILDSQFFGVPQRRRRVFIVASLTRGLPQEVLFERESSPWDSPPRRETGPDVATRTNVGSGKNSGRIGIIEAWDNGQGDPNADDSGLSYSLNGQNNQGIAFGGNNTQGPVSVATSCNAHPSGRYDFESETFIIGSLHNGTPGRDASDAADGKIIVAFDHCIGGSDRTYIHRKPGYAQLQANRPDAIVIGFDGSRGQYTGEIAAPLRVNGAVKPGVNDGKPDNMCVSIASEVRRLTPLECERLQGFPDGYTESQSDTQRYRQLGNAVTVSVAEWLGRRIVKVSGGINGNES